MSFDITSKVLAYVPPDPPLKEIVPAQDRAFFGDPKKSSLLGSASAIADITPHIGTELKGVQISQLTDGQKDELALLVAEVSMYSKTNNILESNFPTEGRGVLQRPRHYFGSTTCSGCPLRHRKYFLHST